jgi:hypothetical protein
MRHTSLPHGTLCASVGGEKRESVLEGNERHRGEGDVCESVYMCVCFVGVGACVGNLCGCESVCEIACVKELILGVLRGSEKLYVGKALTLRR